MKISSILGSLFLLLVACSKPSDCVESTGVPTSKQFELSGFEKIIVNKGIGLVVTQGPDYKVEVRTGANLIDNIDIKLDGDKLILKDNTRCNWVREYGQTVVYVTAPNLTEIYSKTEKNIVSSGTISFPSLRLVSMDLYDGYSGVGIGDYVFEVNNQNITLDTNGLSRFTITGQTNSLHINVFEAGGIVDTQNLLANSIFLYHRGSNDLSVHPLNSIMGDIYNIGNVYSFSKPPIAQVVAHYHGKIIYN